MGIKISTLSAAVQNGHGNLPQNEAPLVLKLIIDEGLNRERVPEAVWDGVIMLALQAHYECSDNTEGGDARRKIRRQLFQCIGQMYELNCDRTISI
jgi:hypothetical protein